MPAFHADSRLDERMHRRRRYVPSPCSPVSGMEDASPELGSFESEEEFSFCSADREFDSDDERGWRSDDPRRELPDDVLSDEGSPVITVVEARNTCSCSETGTEVVYQNIKSLKMVSNNTVLGW